MKILVVEDEDSIGLVLKRLLDAIQQRYPAAEIVWEKTMEKARTHIRFAPLPALIVWDLILPDSGLLMSISTVRTIHPFSPSVIFTGQQRKDVIRELGTDAEEIAIVEKGDPAWYTSLFGAMSNALERRAHRDKKDDTFTELRAIIASLKEKGYAASEPTQSPGPV